MADIGATAAAILYAGAAVLLLGVRSWRQRRATGSTGFRGVTGLANGWPARTAAAGFVLAVAAGLVSPVLARLRVLPQVGGGVDWTADGWLWAGVVVTGFVVTGVGVAVAVAGQQTMGASWRIGVDPSEATALATDGIFAAIRNPIFTGLVALQAGTALMAPTRLAVVGVVAMLVAVELQTRGVEEPHLIAVHGGPYLSYAACTGRFLPGLGRLKRDIGSLTRDACSDHHLDRPTRQRYPAPVKDNP